MTKRFVPIFVVLLCISLWATTILTNVAIKNSTMDATPIGNTTRSTGKFTTLDANSTINATGAISTSNQLVSPQIVLNSQLIRQIEAVQFNGCTVANSGDTCQVVGTWPHAFADASYVPVCTPFQNTFDRNTTFQIDAWNASTVTVGIKSVASNAGYNFVTCVGIHL